MITMPLLFLAGSPGPLELLVIFAVVLILFGPRKLPEIARSIGRMLHELRKASEDFKSQIMSIDESPPAEGAAPATLQTTDSMKEAAEDTPCDEETSGTAEEGDSCDDRENGI